MFKTFVGDTTLHGIRYVVLSPSRIRRMIWLLLLLTTTVVYLFLVYQSMKKYTSNPVNTEYKEQTSEDGTLRFPAVTICNLNRYVKAKIDAAENDTRFYKLGLNLTVCSNIRTVSAGLTCGQALLCAYEFFGTAIIHNCNETIKERLIGVLNRTQVPVFDPEEFVMAYGQSINRILLDYCRFAGKEICLADDFLPTLTERGLCYTFNSGRNNTAIRYTRIGGILGGLSVILDVQADESTIGDFSHGLKVMLHQQGSISLEDKAFNIYPGSHAVVTVTAKQFYRLPAPYSSACAQRTLPGIGVYSKDGCFLQCFANVTLEVCGCRRSGVPGLSKYSPSCTFQHQYCVEHIQATFNRRRCTCELACAEIQYTSQISYSKFPDVSMGNILQHRYNYIKTTEYQRSNLVFLQIGFSDIVYQVSTETPSYGIENLLGDVGGNMGLFLGCSLLTLLEFVDLAWCILHQRITRTKVSSAEDEEGNA